MFNVHLALGNPLEVNHIQAALRIFDVAKHLSMINFAVPVGAFSKFNFREVSLLTLLKSLPSSWWRPGWYKSHNLHYLRCPLETRRRPPHSFHSFQLYTDCNVTRRCIVHSADITAHISEHCTDLHLASWSPGLGMKPWMKFLCTTSALIPSEVDNSSVGGRVRDIRSLTCCSEPICRIQFT